MSAQKEQVKKDQHWAPRFYLKRFADSKNFVQVLDIEKKQIVKQRPYGGVCYDKFFYGKKTGKEDKTSQEFEDILQRVESDIASRVKDFEKIVLNYDKISEEKIYYMASFICLLWARGPYLRNMINNTCEKVMKCVMSFGAENEEYFRKSLIDSLPKEERKKISEKEIDECRKMVIEKDYKLSFNNIQHLMFFKHLEKYTNLFYNKFWRIYIARDSRFITSDTPVSEFIPKRNVWFGPTFLERKHYFSVSPRVLVEIVDPISGKRVKRKQVNNKEVLEFNNLIASHAMRYCYAQRKNEFEEMISYRQYLLKNKT